MDNEMEGQQVPTIETLPTPFYHPAALLNQGEKNVSLSRRQTL